MRNFHGILGSYDYDTCAIAQYQDEEPKLIGHFILEAFEDEENPDWCTRSESHTILQGSDGTCWDLIPDHHVGRVVNLETAQWLIWKYNPAIDLIVTRHPGLVEYLRELGLATDEVVVVSHATPENVAGKRVCGVLPHNLSCLCESFTEVPLNLPPELRGVELTLEQVRLYAGKPVTYTVRVVD